MTATDHFDAKFKIVLLGESTVGKTSILKTLNGEQFNTYLMSTIGVDFIKRVFKVDGHRVMLEIWDTAGQERFRSISAFHYKNAKGFIFVYDVTNEPSYARIRTHWLKSIDDMFEDPVPVFFVGNKLDMSKQRIVTEEDGRKMHEQQSSHGFFETSAKTGENIEALFQHVAEKMAAVWGLPKCYYEQDTNGVDTQKKKSLKKTKKSSSNQRTSIKLHKSRLKQTKCCNKG